MSVEASVSLMVFVLAALSLVVLLSDIGYEERVRQRLYAAVTHMSQVDLQSDAECYGLAAALMALDKEKGRQLLVTSADLKDDGSFRITLSWRNHLPLGGAYLRRYALGGRLITRGRDGLSDFSDLTVFVTDSGSKYHLKDCLHLRLSRNAIKRKEAVKRGYEPCWHCVGGLDAFEKAPGALGN